MDELFSIPDKSQPEKLFYLGTVGSSNSSGVAIIFDGQSAATAKRYKRLSSYSPTVGDRILAVKVSGSYVVLGKIV